MISFWEKRDNYRAKEYYYEPSAAHLGIGSKAICADRMQSSAPESTADNLVACSFEKSEKKA